MIGSQGNVLTAVHFSVLDPLPLEVWGLQNRHNRCFLFLIPRRFLPLEPMLELSVYHFPRGKRNHQLQVGIYSSNKKAVNFYFFTAFIS